MGDNELHGFIIKLRNIGVKILRQFCSLFLRVKTSRSKQARFLGAPRRKGADAGHEEQILAIARTRKDTRLP
jgi:hypothetical protein